MGSRTRHSSGPKAASDLKSMVSALRDELSVIHAVAAVVQRSLTADDGDKPAATTLFERVCCPLADIIGRLDGLFAKVRP